MAIIKTKFDRGVEGATNIVDVGTEGTRLATGTTAQRGSTSGQLGFNTTTGKFGVEIYWFCKYSTCSSCFIY